MTDENETQDKAVDMDEAYDAFKKAMSEDDEFKKELYKEFEGELKQSGVSPKRKNREKGEAFKKAIGPIAHTLSTGTSIEKSLNAQNVEKDIQNMVTKDTTYSDASNAGVTIPRPLANDIIPILESRPVFLDEGQPDMTTMNEGKMEIGRLNQRPQSYWKGETEQYTEGDLGFDSLNLDAHKLTTLVEVSNEYVNRAERADGSFITTQMERSAGNKLDSTFLEGPGGANQPEGVLTQVTGSHVNSSSGSSISDIADDAKRAIQTLAGADVPQDNLRWYMRPEVMYDLMFDISNTEETFVFREELANGRFFGLPYSTTTNLDLDGSDNTNIYLVAMDDIVVGRTNNMRLEMSRHQKFTNDLSIFKLALEYDMKMRHEESAYVIEDYTLQRSV